MHDGSNCVIVPVLTISSIKKPLLAPKLSLTTFLLSHDAISYLSRNFPKSISEELFLLLLLIHISSVFPIPYL